ncbi:hypothetical protein QQF64_003017 [Cirrhinus molitorella]|uniref:non-specific serine/threonine protein kinase n=1 Tax=Cirrhinus molitorella TaxID=172907 RepID=A0ABR3MJ01_9TELE
MEIGLTFMANTGPKVPQIIKLLDWEDKEDHYIMVMERPIPCMDLKSFVKLHGERLDEWTARKVTRQVIKAADVCIKRGVFHRDIKMENLLANQHTIQVRLIDFGCGVLIKKFAYEDFSGTKAYCPLEVTVNGRYHAKLTTVWSAGRGVRHKEHQKTAPVTATLLFSVSFVSGGLTRVAFPSLHSGLSVLRGRKVLVTSGALT